MFFQIQKEGRTFASASSPLENNKHMQNRYLFTVGKVLPFASLLHLLCLQSAVSIDENGSINRPPFLLAQEGRRFAPSPSGSQKKRKNRKQIAFCRV